MIMSSTNVVRLIYGYCLLVGILALQDPQIVDRPSDVITVTGSDITLTCVVENLPVESDLVQWTKDGFALGYDRDIPGFKRYSMVGDISVGEYNLLIKNSSLQHDEGVYECQVRLQRMRSKATVTILVPPQGPVIEDSTDGAINVLAYGTNLITCRSWGGKPAGKLAWYKDGIEIKKNVTYAETSREAGKLQNSSATLRIWPTEKNEDETYECRMTTDEIFREAGFEGQESTRTVKLSVLKPPVASLSISSSEVKEGNNLFATCEAFDSKPSPKSFKWYVNGHILQGNTMATLHIKNINKTLHGASLGCRAVNDVGESEISTTRLNVLYAPILLLAPQDVVTNASTTVNLSCAWDSNPAAIITWYKRGNMNEIVGEGENIQLKINDQNDAGIYACVADARGVGSKSATARIDVLGPPVFNSSEVQRGMVGGKIVINCSLESTPGISHVTWNWNIKGKVMVVENNDSHKLQGKVKYEGVMIYGSKTASLIIYDVTKEDMTEYKCTVQNAYGAGAATIVVQEQTSEAMAMQLPIIGAVVGGILLIIIIVLLAFFCTRRRRQQKSTAFAPEKENLHVEYAEAGVKEDNRLDPLPATVKLISPDADSDNPSTSASVSSRDVVRDPLEDFRNSAHNDDGYHTEEANSWNRHEKQSPSSSPARSTRDEYVRTNYMPPVPMTSSPLERVASPYASSEVASDVAEPEYLRYNIQPQVPYGTQYPMQYGPNGVVELPPAARAASPMNLPMYAVPQSQYPGGYYQGPGSSSSGYRTGPGYPLGPQRTRAGSNVPSVTSSHRSVTPSPYMLGRATPTSVLGDRAMYPVPITAQSQIRPSSSQSSIEHATSSVAAQDPYENPAKMSRISSRMSQASRSTEMLNKPMTARMATHV